MTITLREGRLRHIPARRRQTAARFWCKAIGIFPASRRPSAGRRAVAGPRTARSIANTEPSDEMIAEARDFLRAHAGDTVDDPGYF